MVCRDGLSRWFDSPSGTKICNMNIRNLQIKLRKEEAQKANTTDIIEKIRIANGTMVISQYRQGSKKLSKYEQHGLQKRVNKRAAQFALHKKYAMS